jgi:hypothetical protein
LAKKGMAELPLMTDEEAAYHEAGHAIIARKLRYWCVRVSIRVKNALGDREGACCDNPMKLTRGTAQQRYEDRVAILMAADIAETKGTAGASADHAGFDRAGIYNAVIEYLGFRDPLHEVDAERQRVTSRVRPRAESLVERHWDEITQLARDL